MPKVKVGFVGVGGVAAVHLRNITKNPDATVAAVCDIAEENARRAGEEYGASAYTDFDVMLSNENLDALFICVPPFAHGDMEEKAARLGIHLMVEKPVGLDMNSVEKKLEAINDAGILCATGYCLRYLDTVAIAKEFLSGKDIAMVRGYYLTSFVKTPWFRQMEKSGGQLVEQATHIVDLMRYLAGDIVSVSADMNLHVLKDIQGMNIPDVSSINVTFATKAVGHLDCSLTQPDHRMGLEVMGNGFRVEVNGKDVTIIDGEKTTTYTSKVDFYEIQDHAFIDAVKTKNNDFILSSYENGLKTLNVTLAANRSNEKGIIVQL